MPDGTSAELQRQPDRPASATCASCRRQVALATLAGHMAIVEPDGSEQLHACTAGPVALVAVDGDRLEVVPCREALDQALDALRGRLVGPAGALRPVVGRLLEAGVVPVVAGEPR